MSRSVCTTDVESLPRQIGALQDYHGELVLELIDQRAGESEEELERLYAELEFIEQAIAAIAAGR